MMWTAAPAVVIALALAAHAPLPDDGGVPDALRASDPLTADLEERWLGPAWYANRLQDWRLSDDSIVCVDARLPVRTAHRLDLRIEPPAMSVAGDDGLAITLEVTAWGKDASDRRASAECFAGVLIGAGNATIDHRLTALVQQVPAPEGGLLAVVSGEGVPMILDFSTASAQGFSWTLPTTTSLDSLVMRASGERGGTPFDPSRPISLTVRCSGDGDRFALEVAAAQQGVTRTARLDGLDRGAVDGAIALAAHRAQRRRDLGWSFERLRVGSQDGDDARWLESHPERRLGPILATTYTVDRDDAGAHSLALTAFFPPGFGDRRAELELLAADGWQHAATSPIDAASSTAHFRVRGVDHSLGNKYRVILADASTEELLGHASYEGTLRAPGSGLRLAALNCVKHVVAMTAWSREGVWFPHEDLTSRVLAHDPDMLFFAGDQLYEGDVSGVDQQHLLLDYHTKFGRWLWSFGELCRDRPAVVIPDDHDVFHGNLWGAGGIAARARDGLSAQDAGGYKLPGAVVNAIHRTQVGNLPPRAAEVDAPIEQGIEPYSCRLRFGPGDFLILSDRMWKDSASVLVPEGRCVNGFFRTEDFDARSADRPAANLLGEAQERLLARWATERDPLGPRKILLSQSPFAAVHTLPRGRDDSVVPSLPIYREGEYPEDDAPSADTDTNGWPQSARRRAVRALAQARALHLAGDQHLGSLIQYGVDGHRDGPFAFTPPAIANTWPRRWMPSQIGGGEPVGTPRWLGDFEDAFGNPMTVVAVTNPQSRGITPARLHDLSPGYGIVDIRPTGAVRLTAWPRWADPATEPPYRGWPYELPGQW